MNRANIVLTGPLTGQNLSILYDHGEMRDPGSRLPLTDGACWRFYTRESVERLVEGT